MGNRELASTAVFSIQIKWESGLDEGRRREGEGGGVVEVEKACGRSKGVEKIG